MNSLTTHYRRSQLIALPVPGGKAKVEYCYAVNVPGERCLRKSSKRAVPGDEWYLSGNYVGA
ncbi:TPA: hypothetical protein R3U81_002966 [Escherichia coli]|nr:hypothetical protein [Escherichia coli]